MESRFLGFSVLKYRQKYRHFSLCKGLSPEAQQMGTASDERNGAERCVRNEEFGSLILLLSTNKRYFMRALRQI